MERYRGMGPAPSHIRNKNIRYSYTIIEYMFEYTFVINNCSLSNFIIIFYNYFIIILLDILQ